MWAKSSKWILISLLVAFFIPGEIALGGVIRVPTVNHPNIQAGIDAAIDSDEVVVSDGTYTGVGNKDLDFGGKFITVRSENGFEKCIIDCQGSGRGFYFHSGETSSAVVSGFTIANGQADRGGAIRCSSSPTIIDCKIIGNTAQYSGGGLFCSTRSCTIINCLFLNNTAPAGGGVYCSYAQPVLASCTLVGNAATLMGGGVYISNSAPTITNTILWGSSPSEFYVNSTSDTRGVSHCCVESFEIISPSIIHTNPLFMDVSDSNPENWDLHLSSLSPCIDVGNNNAPVVPFIDFEGDPRIVNGDGTATVDLGADEFVAEEPCYGNVDDDSDVDGFDLAAYEMDSRGITLEQFTSNFGRADCQE